MEVAQAKEGRRSGRVGCGEEPGFVIWYGSSLTLRSIHVSIIEEFRAMAQIRDGSPAFM